MADQIPRRLVAILASDVVGYSRLMGEDEEGTLATLRAHLGIIGKLVVEFDGRVFSGVGDSVMAEFASPVQAVRCAVRVQEELERRNTELPETRRMHFRIGINLGDVMVEDDNLFGDGVNVAARLQALATPGGISISESVYQQIRNKMSLGYKHLGEHSVKNIADPLIVYSVLTAPDAVGKVIGSVARPWTRRWIAAAVLVLVVVAGGVAAWLWPWAPTVEPDVQEPPAFPEVPGQRAF